MLFLLKVVLIPLFSSAHVEEITLYEGQGVSIIQINEDGEVTWQVVATIGTVLLPETAKAICIRAIGDEDICNVVHKVTSTLVEIRGRRIVNGVYRGFKWIASKGKFKSSAVVSTTMFDVALRIKDVFEAYRELGCVEWEDVNAPEGSEGSYDSAQIMLENISNEDVYFQLSCGGDGWESTHLKAGHEMDFAFRIQGYQNFGYCRLHGKTFILYAGRTYRFSKSRTNRSEVEIYLKK